MSAVAAVRHAAPTLTHITRAGGSLRRLAAGPRRVHRRRRVSPALAAVTRRTRRGRVRAAPPRDGRAGGPRRAAHLVGRPLRRWRQRGATWRGRAACGRPLASRACSRPPGAALAATPAARAAGAVAAGPAAAALAAAPCWARGPQPTAGGCLPCCQLAAAPRGPRGGGRRRRSAPQLQPACGCCGCGGGSSRTAPPTAAAAVPLGYATAAARCCLKRIRARANAGDGRVAGSPSAAATCA